MSVRVIEDSILIVIVDDGFATFVEDSGGLSQDWLKGNISIGSSRYEECTNSKVRRKDSVDV